jgi:GNAT superfamily N-acetyltransferase
MNTIIRPARVSDAIIIAEFNSFLAKETENINLNRERLRKGTESLLADTSKGIYYLSEKDNKIVGQLMITYEWSDWRNAIFWWIQSVYILPQYRKHGIFRQLYQYIESLARTRGNVCGLRLYVDTSNKFAQQTYEAVGMKYSHYQFMDIEFDLK